MDFRELYEKVSMQCNIEPQTAKQVCQSIFNIISDEMVAGNVVKINKFGIFEVKVRDARIGFNPKTREALKIPAKKYPSFKPSITLKKGLNKY